MQDLGRCLDVGLGVREELTGRAGAMVGEGKRPVALHDLLAEGALHARAGHAGEVAPGDDPGRADEPDGDHRGRAPQDRPGAHPPAECRGDDPVGDLAQDNSARDRCAGVDSRPAHRYGEWHRVGPHVGPDDPHAADENASLLAQQIP